MVDKDESSPSYSSKDVKKAPRDSRSCTACESTAHLIWRCEKLANSSLRERKLLVKQKRLCFNCLGLGHEVKACPSKARCRTCAKLHHSLLHPSLSNGQASLEPPKQGTSEDAKGPASASANCVSANPTLGSKEVVSISSSCITNVRGRLQVLTVCIINPANGKGQEIFALLDSGTDTHLLSRRVYTELGLPGKPVRSRLQLADGSVKVSDTFDTSLKVCGVNEEVSFLLDNVRVVNALPLLTGSIPSQDDLMRNEHLADINIPIIRSNSVDLLLGMSSPALHVFSEVRESSNSYLWAGKSPLGWVLFGSERCSIEDDDHAALVLTRDLDRESEAICPCQLDFVDLSLDTGELLPSQDDEKATRSMQSSCVWRDGRYCMRFPWKEGCPNLPNNYELALARLKSLDRRLMRDSEIHTKYQDKINEMIRLGHAYEVEDLLCEEHSYGKTWFIPHHFTGRKFRVVFDCAASFGGTSLNSQLLQGPDNTNTLLGVHFRFRLHSVAIVGDIRNMFHQVRVEPVDQSALRFLWWEDGSPYRQVKTYQLTVHLFGLTSSPSVTGFALRRTAEETRSNSFVEAKIAIQRHLYVDDLLFSVPSCKMAVRLLGEISDLLSSGGFQLAKQLSNCREVLGAISPELLAPHLDKVDFCEDALPAHKTLGLVYDPENDRLCLEVAIRSYPLTRRGLLSVMASVYDPLGVVGPYMLPAKLLLRQLADKGLGWDNECSSRIKGCPQANYTWSQISRMRRSLE